MEDFLAIQRREIERSFRENGCLVSFSPNWLRRVGQFHPIRTVALPGFAERDVLCAFEGGSQMASCWARWNYRGYRAAFAAYMAFYFPGMGSQLTRGVHVDHAEPRFRFSHGDNQYVRLLLTPARVNSSYGAGFERRFHATERLEPARQASVMCWLAYAKAMGLLLPGRKAGSVGWQAWAKSAASGFSARSGERADFAYAGFLSVLRLGYTGYYAGEPGGVDHRALCAEY